MEHSQELVGIEDPLSENEDADDGENIFCNPVDDQLEEGDCKDHVQSLIDKLDQETRELKNLLQS